MGLFIALWILITVGVLTNRQEKHAQQRGDASAHYLQAIDKEARAQCNGLPLLEAFLCYVQATQPVREDREREYNLEAQQESTEWDAVAGMMAIGSFVIGGLALWALFRTLDATQAANRGFQESSERQLRAYVAIESSAARRIDLIDPGGVPTGQFQIDIGVIFKNTGQTPALDFSGASVSGLTTMEQIEAEILPDPESAKVIGAGGGVSNSKTRAAIYTNAALATALQAGNTGWFRSRHTYRDIFGVEWELICTLKAFDMQQLMKVQGNTPLSPIKGKNVLRRTDGKSF